MQPIFSAPPDHSDAMVRLLVECLTLVPEALAPRLAALPEARAADYVLQAGEHGVGAYLRRRFIALGLYETLPVAARDGLDAQYRHNAARSLARYHQLGRLLGQLAELRIPVIALKGAYLAKAVYPEPALRPMADLDLLFHVDDIPRVCDLLEANGYRQAASEEPLEWLDGRAHQLPGFMREGAEKIEVHLHITSPAATVIVDREGLWARARTCPLDGRPLLALAAEDLLLHLCLHAVYQHRCCIGLNALLDIALVVEREPLDWETLVARAERWRASPYCSIGLRLSQRLLGAAVPDEVIERLALGGNADRWLSLAESEILQARAPRGPVSAASTAESLKLALIWSGRFKTLVGHREKLAKVYEILFPPADVLAVRYPRLGRSRLRSVLYTVYWMRPVARLARAVVAGRGRLRAWHALDKAARS